MHGIHTHAHFKDLNLDFESVWKDRSPCFPILTLAIDVYWESLPLDDSLSWLTSPSHLFNRWARTHQPLTLFCLPAEAVYQGVATVVRKQFSGCQRWGLSGWWGPALLSIPKNAAARFTDVLTSPWTHHIPHQSCRAHLQFTFPFSKLVLFDVLKDYFLSINLFLTDKQTFKCPECAATDEKVVIFAQI